MRGAAGEIAARLADNAGGGAAPGRASTPTRSTGRPSTLRDGFDERFGGFGGAPKFPPSMVLEFLLRHHERTGVGRGAAPGRGDRASGWPAAGMYDQLAGGFARYSVDARWVVPHFEKMLYDNALLLRVYAHLARVTGDELPRRVADGDRGVPAARPAHRRGRLRLRAGRGHRRASRA